MRKIVLGLGLIGLIVPSAALADWVDVTTSSVGAVYYLDPARVTKSGNHLHAWFKVDHSNDRTVKYRRQMLLYSFNCAKQTTSLLSYTEYDSYGKVMGSRNFQDYGYSEANYQPVTPESVGEALLQAACLFDR